MVLILSELLPFENGCVLVLDGNDYATLEILNQTIIDSFDKVCKGDRLITSVGIQPRLCQLLGVVAVPTVVIIRNGAVSSSMVGISNEQQLLAFIETGVSPC